MLHVGLSSVQHWIVSAWWPEQRELAEWIAGAAQVQNFNEQISIAGRIGFLRTGVGTPRAAASLANVLALAKSHGSCAESVVFVATAGAYSRSFTMGAAHLVSSVSWTDGDLVSGRSYLPGLKSGVETLSSPLSVFSKSGHSAISTPGITLDASLTDELSQKGALENLELYGVALAAENFGVAWGAALGVSNFVGANAHSEWKENHLLASKAAQDLVYETYLRALL